MVLPIFLCFGFEIPTSGQNLIADPSFEEIPCHGKGVTTSPNWFNLKTQIGIYNECNPEPYQRPSFKAINQTPKFGSAFAESHLIATEYIHDADYQIAIAVLNDTLMKGHKYFLSLFVSLKKSEPLAIKEFGANFLDHFPDTNVFYRDQPFFGQYDWENTNGLLDDTIGWEKVGGQYTAKGDEFIVAFGCMLPFEKVTMKNMGIDDFSYSVYFLDGFTLIPFPELPNDTLLCEGDTLRLTPNVPKDAFYQWNTGQIGGTLTVTQPGWYWAMNYSAFDTIYDSIYVDYFPLGPQHPKLSICGEDKVLDLDVSGIYEAAFSKVEWADGRSGGRRIFEQPGDFPFKAYIAKCVLVDTLSISIIPAPDPLSAEIDLCENNPIWLSVETDTYDSTLWNGVRSDSILLNQSAFIKRQVYGNNCLFEDSTDATIWPDIRYTNIDTSICSGVTFDLTFDTLAVQYQSFKSLDVREPGTYVLDYYNGCDTQHLKINVIEEIDCNCPVFIPNAFTPNGNTINDTFKIFTDCAIETQLFRVFNRWGQLLYESDKSTLWTGEHTKRDDVYMHTYFFTWSATLIKNGKQHKVYYAGHIAVVR